MSNCREETFTNSGSQNSAFKCVIYSASTPSVPSLVARPRRDRTTGRAIQSFYGVSLERMVKTAKSLPVARSIPLSKKEAKVLWVMAVCQNHKFRASRGLIGAILNMDRKLVSNTCTRIRKKNPTFFASEPLGHPVPRFKNNHDADRDELGYFIVIQKNVSSVAASRIAIELEDLIKESNFMNRPDFERHVSRKFRIKPARVHELMGFLLKTGYVEVAKNGILQEASAGRIQAERNYLSLLSSDPEPSFLLKVVFD